MNPVMVDQKFYLGIFKGQYIAAVCAGISVKTT